MSIYYNDNQIGITSLEEVYPVGSIYIDTSNVNPVNIFNFGTWERIEDAFIFSCRDENVTTGYDVPKILSNEIRISNTEIKLSIDNILPHTHTVNSHTHTIAHTHKSSAGRYFICSKRADSDLNSAAAIASYASSSNWATGAQYFLRGGANANFTGAGTANTDAELTTMSTTTSGATGGGNSFNIEPTYIAMPVWVRIA